MLTEFVSVSTKKITLRELDLIIDFSSSSLISSPLRMFQEQTLTPFLVVFCWSFLLLWFSIGTESIGLGLPIVAVFGILVVVQPGSVVV